MGEGVGDRGKETGATAGTGVGEVGGDTVGVSGTLDGDAQARIISSEADTAVSSNVPFMALIFSGSADPRHVRQGSAMLD